MATVERKMSKGRKAAHVEESMEEEPRHAQPGGECDPGMLVMLKALMAEQRKNEIAREEARERAEERREERREELRMRREEEALRKQVDYQKELEEKQVEQQAVIEKRQREQQELIEKRQHESQKQLVEMQAEIGREASRLHREQMNVDKKKERALFSVPTFREGEDLEEFLVLMEERMIAAGVEKNEWVASVSSKLTGRLAAAWREVTAAAPDYEGARIRFLEGSGYTPIAAADRFFGFKFEQCKGLSAGELYQKGLKLARRMLAPCVATPELEFALLKGWIYTVIPKRARASLDARVVSKAAELVAALQDFLTLEGESESGVTAVFKGRTGEGFRERSSLTCFTCGKVGHRAIDCWQGKGVASGPKEGAAGPKTKIVCFTCGIEGHKSPQCPRNVRIEEGAGKDARPKPIKRIWVSPSGCAQLEGVVNGHEAHVLLDSGADISVVPEGMVHPSQLDGRSVAVRPFGATAPMILPVAEIAFQVGELEWKERVAVAPMLEDEQGEVLCRLDIKSKRGLKLVMLANEVEVKRVEDEYLRVKKERAEKEAKRKREKELLEEAIVGPNSLEGRAIEPGTPVASGRVNGSNPKCVPRGIANGSEEEPQCEEEFGQSEKPIVKALVVGDHADEIEKIVFDLTDSSVGEESMVIPPVIAVTLDRAALVAEAGVLKDVVDDEVLDSLVDLFSEDVEEIVDDEVLGSMVDLFAEDEEKIVFDLTDSRVCEGNMVIPPVIAGTLDRAALVAEACTDPTLEYWRRGAEKEIFCCLGEDYDDILCFEKDSSDDGKEDEVVSVMKVELEVEIVGSEKVEVEVDVEKVEVGKVEVEEVEVDVEKVEVEKVEVGKVEVEVEVVGIATVEVEVDVKVEREVLNDVIKKLEEIDKVETLGLGKCYKFKDECWNLEDWIEDLKDELPGVFAAGLGGIGACKLEDRMGDSPPSELGLCKVPDILKTNVKEEIDRMLELAVPGHRATARVKLGMLRSKGQLRAFLGSVDFARKSVFELVWKPVLEFVWKLVFEFAWEFVFLVAWKFAVEFVWKLVFEFAWKFVFLVAWKFAVEFVWKLVFEFVWKLVFELAWKFAPTVVTWEPEMLEAFNSLRVSLCNCCVLNVPGEGDVFSLHTVGKSLRRNSIRGRLQFWLGEMWGSPHWNWRWSPSSNEHELSM